MCARFENYILGPKKTDKRKELLRQKKNVEPIATTFFSTISLTQLDSKIELRIFPFPEVIIQEFGKRCIKYSCSLRTHFNTRTA